MRPRLRLRLVRMRLMLTKVAWLSGDGWRYARVLVQLRRRTGAEVMARSRKECTVAVDVSRPLTLLIASLLPARGHGVRQVLMRQRQQSSLQQPQ